MTSLERCNVFRRQFRWHFHNWYLLLTQNATIQTSMFTSVSTSVSNIKVMELYLNEKSLAHEDTILICLQIIWYVNVYSVHVLCQEVMNLSYNARLMALTCILKVALTLPPTSWHALPKQLKATLLQHTPPPHTHTQRSRQLSNSFIQWSMYACILCTHYVRTSWICHTACDTWHWHTYILRVALTAPQTSWYAVLSWRSSHLNVAQRFTTKGASVWLQKLNPPKQGICRFPVWEG